MVLCFVYKVIAQSPPRLSRFSVCDFEKLRGAWEQGYHPATVAKNSEPSPFQVRVGIDGIQNPLMMAAHCS